MQYLHKRTNPLTGSAILLFLSISLMIPLHLKSQVKFSDNPAAFVDEMRAFLLADAGKDKQLKASVDTLMQLYDREWNFAFTLDQQMMVIKSCNLMGKKKMQARPHFMEFLPVLMAMAQSGQPEQSFLAWNQGLNYIIEKKQKDFRDFVAFTDGLLSRNMLYESNLLKWQASGSDYVFITEEGRMKVAFRITDLTCYAFNDSSVIAGTEGIYDPIDQRWTGQGGKVTWRRVGIPEDEVNATLTDYQIRTQFSKFSADSVLFYHKRYFPEPQLGRLSENVQYFKDTLSASYPRFESYNKWYVVQDYYKGVDFEGGYAFHGARFLGTGDLNKPASFTFKYKGNIVVRVTAPSFTIRPDRFSSNIARVVIYLDDDSIFHPGLEVEYRDMDRRLSMYTVESGTGQSRFFNTYHGVDIAAEELHWNVDEGKLQFRTEAGLSGASQAYFESRNYYSRKRFDDMQGIDAQNPLFQLRQYSQQNASKTFLMTDYARWMRMDPEQVMVQMISLANQGYVEYNIEKGEITLQPRVANTLMAFGGLVDYDVIQFYSATVAGTPNAEIDLNTLNLDIYGLQDVIQLSDSQNVFIEPDHGHVVMQEDRSFLFSGNMRIGLFRFKVKDASFNYRDFSIDAPDIRSVVFYVNSFDPNDLDSRGERTKVPVKTELTDLSGKIALDKPDNKSGRKDYPRYPIFTCTTEGYAYYDSKDIHKGTYIRDKFFYRIEPFEVDSLDDFSTDGFALSGTLVSAGIFPDINPPLQVRPDYSLGFVHEVPAGGLPAYQGKGTYYRTLDLSNKGFYGIGELGYLTSKGVSENYLFTPDSASAVLKQFDVAEKGGLLQYPDVKASDVLMRWMPYGDRMEINHRDKYRRLKENPMEMFNQRALLHGNLVLTPSGCTGEGAVVIRDAEIDSRLFAFGQRTIDSEHSDFRLKATFADEVVGILPSDGYELMTLDYRAHIDFDREVGEFTSNGGASMVNFLINQYMASIDKFEWHMNAETIKLQNTTSVNAGDLSGLTMEELVDRQMAGSEFISTSPFQDSLRFFALEATYDRKKNIIDAQGVKFIKVADAAVFPDKERVVIFRKAEMDTLRNARLLTNLQTKYHRFYNVTTQISGRNQYDGSGYYDYVDMTSAKQKIPFQRLYADKSGHSTGEGKLVPEDKFSLSPRFDFHGDVVMRSSAQFLTFTGGTMLIHLCDTMQREWLRFTADIDPLNVQIPVSSKPVNTGFRELGIGILVSRDTSQVYASFFDLKHRAADKPVIYADGMLLFDEETSEYRVSNPKKLLDITEGGNYVSLNTAECMVHGEGKLAIGEGLGLLKMETLGKADYSYRTDSLTMELVMALDFFFSDPALKVFVKDLESAGGLGVSLNNDAYLYALNHWVGSTKAEDLEGEIALYGTMRKIPEELNKTIVFADIQLEYNAITKSFIYQGPIGIGNVKENQINRYVDGKIEISREKTGDVFTILLYISDEKWYLFDYSRGRMMALSGNEEFNKVIRDTKPDKRKIQDESSREMFLYTLSTPRKKKSFEKRFQNLEEPEEE